MVAIGLMAATSKRKPRKILDRHSKSRLEWFGLFIYKTLDEYPYLVGSACYKKDFRDVDLRVIVDDDRFKELFGDEVDWRDNPMLEAANLAFSALGKEMTGLPIDFQFQQMTNANSERANEGSVRNALGVYLNVRESQRDREEPQAPRALRPTA